MSNNLNEIRVIKGYTQSQIAQVLKVTQSNVSNYENGNYNLNENQIIILCNFLSCTADQLLGLKKYKKHTKKISSIEESQKINLKLRFRLFNLMGAFNYLYSYEDDIKKYDVHDVENFNMVFQKMFKDAALSSIIIKLANFWLQKDRHSNDISISSLLDYLDSKYTEISQLKFKFHNIIAGNSDLFNRLKLSRDKVNAHITNYDSIKFEFANNNIGFSITDIASFSKDELLFLVNNLADIMQEILDIYVLYGYKHELRNLKELKLT